MNPYEFYALMIENFSNVALIQSFIPVKGKSSISCEYSYFYHHLPPFYKTLKKVRNIVSRNVLFIFI